ncbi:HAD-IC family P-type ATPase (plasmid) [Streptomyces sp. BI20]|uniref:HAD-IC family P-type ATPase n=1 Tax=Streptomyces sp. BI20 TaxID=3403460 RepID=UPI003C749312
MLREVDSGPRGLTEAEAARRLLVHGENRDPRRRAVTPGRLLLRALREPFTLLLLGLVVISAVAAAPGTAVVLFVLAVAAAALRAREERRAERLAAGLGADGADETGGATVTVVRRADGGGGGGRAREVPVGDLVPGDVVRLGPGDAVPADLWLLGSAGLTVHQDALTGESRPVPKSAPALEAEGTPEPDAAPDAGAGGPFGDPRMVFRGSAVATGSARAVVVATGARTRIASAPVPSRWPTGPFERSLRSLSWLLLRLALPLPALAIGVDAVTGGHTPQTWPFAVAVTVGLVPEMLPLVLTTRLSRAAAELARARRVLVPRLPALYDLGAVDVLCLDKTGTLTEGRPVVHASLDTAGREDPRARRWAAVNAWWSVHLAETPAPDAVDAVLLEECGEEGDRAGLGGEAGEGAPPAHPELLDPLAVLPFDPTRRFSAVAVRAPGRPGHRLLVVKGAAHEVLDRCALAPEERTRLADLVDRAADEGLGVLLVALAETPLPAPVSGRPHALRPEHVRGLRPVGLLTLRDAPAAGAERALAGLVAAGVSPRVLTGDHPGTARRACRDLGLPVAEDEVRTAADLDALSGPARAEALARTRILARCAPADKARFLAELRAAGHTVGFLGDGVNDVPALRAADVALVPRGAVPAAREQGDVLLVDKDLTAVGDAITAGRRAAARVVDHLRVTLSANLGNATALLAAGAVLPFAPMLPAQVLVQNLCFDAAQLAFTRDRRGGGDAGGGDARDGGGDGRPGRPVRWATGRLGRLVLVAAAVGACADLVTLAALGPLLDGWTGAAREGAVHTAWFTENLLTQALALVLLPRLTRGAGTGTRAAGWAASALALVGLGLPLSPWGGALGFGPVPVTLYAVLAGVAAGYAAAVYGVCVRFDGLRRGGGAGR